MMRKYDPIIRPLEESIGDIGSFENIRVIGLDWMIDAGGVPYFLEGNGTCFGLRRYNSLYDNQLDEAFLSLFENYDDVGINILPEDWINDSFRKSRAYETEFARKLLETEGKNVHLFRDKDLIKNGIEERIDVLFNRVPGIPESYDEEIFSIPTISSVSATKLLVDKYLTIQAVKNLLPTPETYLVQNKDELVDAIKKVENHVRENHLNYYKPWIVLKPVDDTGSRGIYFLDDSQDSIPEIEFPYLVEEKIESQKHKESAVDVRTYFINGWSSRGMGRVAPEKWKRGANPYETLITGLSQNGRPVLLTERANELLSMYTEEAAKALEIYLRIK